MIIRTIIEKEREDIFRNKRMLLIMFLFPIMYLIMSLIAGDILTEDGSAFILMHIVLVPIMTIATIVAEEKEKSTLKLLVLSGVNTIQYIVGIIIIIMMFIIIGLLIFDFQGALRLDTTVQDVILIFISVICSMLIGSLIGATVPNQMSVGPIAIPIILIIFFIPVSTIFLPKYKCFTKYLYSSVAFDILKGGVITFETIWILALNLVLIGILFILLFNRRRVLQDIK